MLQPYIESGLRFLCNISMSEHSWKKIIVLSEKIYSFSNWLASSKHFIQPDILKTKTESGGTRPLFILLSSFPFFCFIVFLYMSAGCVSTIRT